MDIGYDYYPYSERKERAKNVRKLNSIESIDQIYKTYMAFPEILEMREQSSTSTLKEREVGNAQNDGDVESVMNLLNITPASTDLTSHSTVQDEREIKKMAKNEEPKENENHVEILELPESPVAEANKSKNVSNPNSCFRICSGEVTKDCEPKPEKEIGPKCHYFCQIRDPKVLKSSIKHQKHFVSESTDYSTYCMQQMHKEMGLDMGMALGMGMGMGTGTCTGKGSGLDSCGSKAMDSCSMSIGTAMGTGMGTCMGPDMGTGMESFGVTMQSTGGMDTAMSTCTDTCGASNSYCSYGQLMASASGTCPASKETDYLAKSPIKAAKSSGESSAHHPTADTAESYTTVEKTSKFDIKSSYCACSSVSNQSGSRCCAPSTEWTRMEQGAGLEMPKVKCAPQCQVGQSLNRSKSSMKNNSGMDMDMGMHMPHAYSMSGMEQSCSGVDVEIGPNGCCTPNVVMSCPMPTSSCMSTPSYVPAPSCMGTPSMQETSVPCCAPLPVGCGFSANYVDMESFVQKLQAAQPQPPCPGYVSNSIPCYGPCPSPDYSSNTAYRTASRSDQLHTQTVYSSDYKAPGCCFGSFGKQDDCGIFRSDCGFDTAACQPQYCYSPPAPSASQYCIMPPQAQAPACGYAMPSYGRCGSLPSYMCPIQAPAACPAQPVACGTPYEMPYAAACMTTNNQFSNAY